MREGILVWEGDMVAIEREVGPPGSLKPDLCAVSRGRAVRLWDPGEGATVSRVKGWERHMRASGSDAPPYCSGS